jgi:6-phosphogluconolactonase
MAVKILKDLEAMVEFAARQILLVAQNAVAENGRFTLALAGGTTPRLLYQLLTTPPWINQIPWAKTHIFWGDERCVPPDHPDSNYRMAQGTLLDNLPALAGIHRIKGELPPTEAADEYQVQLRSVFGDALPRFDMMLQGMGADGHTASLFPETRALGETERWVVANQVPTLGTWRITLTYPVLNHARNMIFLVAGADKADTLYEVLHGEYHPHFLPTQAIKLTEGELWWVVDYAAGRRIFRKE